MKEAKSRQPLISEVIDLTNIPSCATTTSMLTPNLNQTYDNARRKKRTHLSKRSSDNLTSRSLALCKEEKIKDFILNEKQYEQQKQLKLNELKTQQRLITSTTLHELPEIDAKSSSLAHNNKPIYDRVREVNQKKQENIETLRLLYVHSAKEEQTPSKAKTFAGYSEKTLNWVKKQGDAWLKKRNKTHQLLLTDKEENGKCQLNQMLPTQSTNRVINKDFAFAKSSLNLKRELLSKENNLSFTPILNRNKSETSKVYPNYIPLNPKKRRTKVDKCKKKNRSVDMAYAIEKTAKPKNEHWSSLIQNLQKGQVNDKEFMYRINICPSGAWNENCLNKVNLNGQTKKILSHLLY